MRDFFLGCVMSLVLSAVVSWATEDSKVAQESHGSAVARDNLLSPPVRCIESTAGAREGEDLPARLVRLRMQLRLSAAEAKSRRRK